MTVAAIVLAAGASRRMGQPKPLLAWGGTTLIQWEYDELLRSPVDEIVIVTGSRSDYVRRVLGEGAGHCVFNARWAQGRATSLATGARALIAGGRRLPDFVVIQNVDQPTRHDIIDRLLAALRQTGADAVQPTYQGKSGHPVVLRGQLLAELAAARDAEQGLRGILVRHTVERVPMDDEPVVRLDLDTPDTLDEGRRLLGVR